jgi:hypothetical protein
MSGSKQVLNRETLLPLSLVIAIVGGILWLNNQLILIDYRLGSIENKMAEKTSDLWTGRDMAHWAYLLTTSNPGLNVPPAKRRDDGEGR